MGSEQFVGKEAELTFRHGGLFLFALLALFRVIILHTVKRRKSAEHLACRNQLRHKSVKESQQQCTDVRTVDIGIGQDDNLAKPELRKIKFIPDSAAKWLQAPAWRRALRICGAIHPCLPAMRLFWTHAMRNEEI